MLVRFCLALGQTGPDVHLGSPLRYNATVAWCDLGGRLDLRNLVITHLVAQRGFTLQLVLGKPLWRLLLRDLLCVMHLSSMWK